MIDADRIHHAREALGIPLRIGPATGSKDALARPKRPVWLCMSR